MAVCNVYKTPQLKTINNNSLYGIGDLTVGGSYTAGDGIDITNNEISNTAPIWHGDDVGSFTTPINADQLQGYTVSTLLNLVYPIGSIYMSASSVSPQTLFGGTWVQLEDRFLLGAGSTYTAGTMDGEATHTLTISEMPSHGHKLLYGPGSGASFGYTYTNSGAWSGSDAESSSGIRHTGGSQAHNNMPPYLVVYMWERTA